MEFTSLCILCFYLLGTKASTELVFVADILYGGPIYSASFDSLNFDAVSIEGLGYPYSITFNPVDDKLYWSDVVNNHIARASPDGRNLEVLVDGVYSEGLAVDGVSQQLFWGNTNEGNIWRASLNGTGPQVILETVPGLGGIVIDELASHIYWTSYSASPPKIERANTDGSERLVLVDTGLASPQGLAIDFRDKRMYWADAQSSNVIEASDLLGNNRQVLLKDDSLKVNFLPIGIAVRGDYVYWTSWQIRTLVRMNKNGLEPPEKVGTVNLEQAGGIYVSQVLEEFDCPLDCQNEAPCRQLTIGFECVCRSGFQGELCENVVTDESHRCDSQPCLNEGRCIQRLDDYFCECGDGYLGRHCEIETDGSCASNPCVNGMCQQRAEGYRCECQEGFSGQLCEIGDLIFVADQFMGMVHKASLPNIADTLAVLPLNIGQPTSLAIDLQEQIIYWADNADGTIRRSEFNGTGIELFMDGLIGPTGLSISEIARMIFWINNGTEIQASSLDNINKQVILTDLDSAQDIAVDSIRRQIYWTSVGEQPKIERAQENGTLRTSIIDTNMMTPTGLTLDIKRSQMYWSDAGKNTLETAKLDGSNRLILTDLSELADLNPFNVEIYGDFMYWTDQSLTNLGVVHRYLGIVSVVGPQFLARASGLAIYTASTLDTEPPLLTCPPDMELTVGYSELPLRVSWPEPTYTDDTGVVTVRSSHQSGMEFSIGSHEITYRAWDFFDNMGKCSFLINITNLATTSVPQTTAIPAYCPEESFTLDGKPTSWESTRVGLTVDSFEVCSLPTKYAGYSLANRTCFSADNNDGAMWGTPMWRDCGPEQEISIAEINQTPITAANAEEVAMALTDTVLQEGGISAEDMINIADILTNIVAAESEDPQVTTSIVGLCSSIVLATNNSESDQQLLKILRALDDQVSISAGLGHSLTTVQSNLAVTTVSVDPQQASNSDRIFGVRQNTDNNSFRQGDIIMGGSNDMEGTRASISLPPSVFNRASGNGNVGIGFTAHNSDTFFATNLEGGRAVVGPIIAASIPGITNLTNLDPPVEIEIMAPGNYSGTCAFWDFDEQDWSSEGCEYKGRSSDGMIVCHCSHLTNFAVIADSENPVIRGTISDITNNTLPGESTAFVTWPHLTASDNSGSVTLTSNYESGDAFPIGSTTVTYTAVDPSGNKVMLVFRVTVRDEEKPIFLESPKDITINTDPGQPHAVVSWERPVASDNSGNVTLSSNYNPGDSFPIGSTTVEYTAVDASGNEESIKFTIAVEDVEKPVISNIPNTIPGNTDPRKRTGTVTWMVPTASDNSGSVTLIANYNPGDAFPIGETQVRYTATDESGNTATAMFVITITDKEKPRILSGCPSFIEVYTDQLSSEVTWFDPLFVDNSGQNVELNSSYSSPSTFAIGMKEVVYHARDPYDNVANCTITINVTAACLATTYIDESETLSWPLTPAPKKAVESIEICDLETEKRGNRLGVRDCNFNENTGSTWGMATNEGCGVVEKEVNLTVLAETPVVENNVDNVAEALNNATEDLTDLTADDLENVADTIINIVDVESTTTEVTTAVVGIVDNLVTASDTGTDPNEGENMSEQSKPYFIEILTAFEEQVTRATMATSFEQSLQPAEPIVEPNIILTTTTVPQNDLNMGISFTVTKSQDDVAGKDVDGFEKGNAGLNKDVPEEEQRSSVSLPASLFNTTGIGIECFSDTYGTDYRGQQSNTLNGIRCQNWTSQMPHNHNWTHENYPNDGLGDHNYCRNPGGERQFAWCLTIDPNTTWDYCDIGKPQEACEATAFGVSFVVHRSDILFPSNTTNQTRIVGGDIISAIVTGVDDVSNLTDPVVLNFTSQGENATCVFWSFNISDWTPNGCKLASTTRISETRNRVTCFCYHLTNFAVLVDFDPGSSHFVLDIVSKVGCGLSMVALLITLVIFLAFRRLRRGAQATQRKILIQLCVSLFLLYLVFLVGIDSNKNRVGCVFVAALLHFLTLASLMWMGVEAYNMYLSLVKVFMDNMENFLLKAAIVAWGVPLVVTAISLGAGFSYYDHQKYCFVSTGPSLYYGVILPVGIILLFNLIMFALVMHSLCKANLGGNVTHQSQARKMSQRLQNAFIISVLMGLTWVFGFFAIEDAEFVFSLIFCLCNSLQGVAIFILFCLRQDDVRKTLRPIFRRLCGLSEDASHRSQTASTGVLSSSATQSTKSPYSDVDFSATAMPSAKMFEATNVTYGVNVGEPRYETTVDKKEPHYESADPPAEYESTFSSSKPSTTDAADDVRKGQDVVESAEEAKELPVSTKSSMEERQTTSSPTYETKILAGDTKESPKPTSTRDEEREIQRPLLHDTESGKDTGASESTSVAPPDGAVNESFEMEPMQADRDQCLKGIIGISKNGDKDEPDKEEVLVEPIKIEEHNPLKDAVIEIDK